MKKKLTLILDILVFLCLLFMGADTLSIELGAYSFRLGQIFFPFAAIGLCCLRAYNFKYILYTFPMILIMFLYSICNCLLYKAKRNEAIPVDIPTFHIYDIWVSLSTVFTITGVPYRYPIPLSSGAFRNLSPCPLVL